MNFPIVSYQKQKKKMKSEPSESGTDLSDSNDEETSIKTEQKSTKRKSILNILTSIQLQRLKEIPKDARSDSAYIRFLLDAICTRRELANSSFSGHASNFNKKSNKALDVKKTIFLKGII